LPLPLPRIWPRYEAMTYEALEATMIGRTVNGLRKTAPSALARLLADTLYRQWKTLVDE
jgi:hypothetical protein